MKIENEIKKQIIENFIDIFTRIASKEFQKRIWISGQGPEVDDFDETVNDYSLESDFVLDNYKELGVTEFQRKVLAEFHLNFVFFYKNNNFPHEFIDTPEWNKITVMAKDVLKAFDYKKTRL